jgi:hypothetical protein
MIWYLQARLPFDQRPASKPRLNAKVQQVSMACRPNRGRALMGLKRGIESNARDETLDKETSACSVTHD